MFEIIKNWVFLGLKGDFQMDVFKMLAAILHLGNVEVTAVGDERSSISVRKQLIHIPVFSFIFYAKSPLATIFLIFEAQSSIKSGYDT